MHVFSNYDLEIVSPETKYRSVEGSDIPIFSPENFPSNLKQITSSQVEINGSLHLCARVDMSTYHLTENFISQRR